MKIELSKEEVGQALVHYAAFKAGVKGAFKHQIRINGTWTTIGDGPAVVVELEPVALTTGGQG